MNIVFSFREGAFLGAVLSVYNEPKLFEKIKRGVFRGNGKFCIFLEGKESESIIWILTDVRARLTKDALEMADNLIKKLKDTDHSPRLKPGACG